MFISKKKFDRLSDDLYEVLLENVALQNALAKSVKDAKSTTKPVKKTAAKKAVKK